MQKLRTNPLPKKLTQFRTVANTFPAAFTSRSQMLAQLHGYPYPAHVVAAVWRYFNLADLNSLKEGLIKLRDCVYYASEALNALRLLRAERYQLALGEVQEYITEHAKDFGYNDLNSDDLSLVSYLMTSAEVQDSSWLLDLSAEPSENFYARMLKLYSQACAPSTVPQPKYSSSQKEVGFADDFIRNQQKYYVPVKDKLEPISSIVTPPGILKSIGTQISSLSQEADITNRLSQMQRQLQNETRLFALADVRLLDHILLLLTNTAIWDTFITPRTKPDPSQNAERASGLKLFAGYLQALLVYPHLLRYEMFKQGYENLEKWHGSFPAIPPDVKQNYEQYIRAYDFLDAAQDSRDLYGAYFTANDPNLDSEVHVQFVEMTTLYGIDDVFTGNTPLEPEVNPIKLEKLSELEDQAYHGLLLSFPLKRFPLLDDIQVRMLERSRFAAISNQMFSAVMPGTNRFFSDAFLSRLHALNARVPFSWHPHIPGSSSYARGASSEITTGKFPMRYLAPWATAENQYLLRTKEIYKIFNANSLVSAYPWRLSVDHSAAEKLRKSVARSWRSLYPSTIVAGERLLDATTISSSPLEVERLLESMTGEPFAMIRKALFNEPLSEIWATYLSSFALLYRKTDKMDVGVLIPGLGMPYGVTYSALADMQKFDPTKDFIHIPRTDSYLALIRTIPTPSDDLAVGDFHLQIPYYYFPGNGSRINVQRFTFSDGLLHLALRPVQPLPADRLILFDKLSIYRNDTLLIQVDDRASYRTDLSADEIFSVPLSNTNWPGDKATAQLEYVTIGSYGSGGSLGISAPPADSVAQEVQRLAEEMRQDLTTANSNSSINTLEEHSKEGAVSESQIASEINRSSSRD